MSHTLRIVLATCCLLVGLVGCSGGGSENPDGGSPPPSDGGDTDKDGGKPDGDLPFETCDGNPCGDHSTCEIDGDGVRICGCESGYIRVGNVCELSFCATNNGGCDLENAVCTPNADNRSAQCVCKDGFLGNGKICLPDQCKNNADCDVNATCTRLPGQTHSCACKDGFVGNGYSCIEDRCLEACPSHSTCTNDRSKDRCVCDTNYEKDGELCVPKRPCDNTSTFTCADNASCENKEDGTYDCTCNLGYEGDGKVLCTELHPCQHHVCQANSTCIELNNEAVCNCDQGYRKGSNPNLCENIDECAEQLASCGGAFDCVDTQGSYSCVCKPGTVGNEVIGCRAGYMQKPAVGKFHMCAVSDDGKLWCWGRNDLGQLGQLTSVTASTYPRQVGSATDWVSVEAGDNHNCAIKTDGSLWCWGNNAAGQLGNGEYNDPALPPLPPITSPIRVSGNWTDVVYVAAGADFTCAVRETSPGVQTLWCWGNPANGRLGRPSTTSGPGAFLLPDQVGTDTNWASVTAGDGHACGLKTTGEALCWGVNSLGQLGTGDFNNRSAPAPVTTPAGASSSVGWEMVTTSGTFTCGLADGELYCWGSNSYGQVEAPTYDISFTQTNTSVNLPTQIVAGSDCTDVAAGALHACGICSGELWCWGYDASGQAGYCPEVDLVTPPMQVGTRTDWMYVGAGSMQSSANRTDGTLWSWGANSYGQLGDSSVSRACAPVAVN